MVVRRPKGKQDGVWDWLVLQEWRVVRSCVTHRCLVWLKCVQSSLTDAVLRVILKMNAMDPARAIEFSVTDPGVTRVNGVGQLMNCRNWFILQIPLPHHPHNMHAPRQYGQSQSIQPTQYALNDPLARSPAFTKRHSTRSTNHRQVPRSLPTTPLGVSKVPKKLRRRVEKSQAVREGVHREREAKTNPAYEGGVFIWSCGERAERLP